MREHGRTKTNGTRMKITAPTISTAIALSVCASGSWNGCIHSPSRTTIYIRQTTAKLAHHKWGARTRHVSTEVYKKTCATMNHAREKNDVIVFNLQRNN